MSLLNHFSKSQAPTGQAGLLFIAVMIMLVLVIGGSLLGNISHTNATHTIATKQSLQTYYAAQAGIQEAIASRMLPRSNYMQIADPANAYYNVAGKLYRIPGDTSSGLVGLYRYVVLGGDSARDANGNYFATNSNNPNGIPRLVTSDTIAPTSPFIVVSKGLTCKPVQGKSIVKPDLFTSTDLQPACKAGYQLDELTLVEQIQLLQEYASPASQPKDKISSLQVYKDSANFQLPSNAFVPGYGWANTGTSLNFEKIWAYSPASAPNTSAQANPITLQKVVFYNFADNTIYDVVNVTGTNITANTAIPPKSVIRLYFNGPVDYRSISNTPNDRSLDACDGPGADSCNIRVMQGTSSSGANGTAYTGNSIVPLFPGGTQIILLPPLYNNIAGNQYNAIKVDTSKMKTFSNSTGTSNYTIVFQTTSS